MGKNENRRRQVIVNKPLQRRVILTSMWVPCLCLITSSLLLALFCKRLHDEAVYLDLDLPSVVPIFLTTVGFVLLATGFTIVHGVKLSQRIAGPVVNFERTLQRFRDGDRSARIHLRKLDLLIDAADRVNEFLDWAEEQLPAETETMPAADHEEALQADATADAATR